jgi:hypothetical protein
MRTTTSPWVPLRVSLLALPYLETIANRRSEADDYTHVDVETGANSSDEYSEVAIEEDDTDAWSVISS